MAMTFDATLKDMGRDSPQGFLAAFDRPPTLPVRFASVTPQPTNQIVRPVERARIRQK
jgi:hypothetical protein